MRFVYWFAWILAALAFWLTFGWLGIKSVAVDRYFDRQVDGVVATVGSPGKADVAAIEKQRRDLTLGLGVLGGVVCGFAFGAAAYRWERRSR